jgi:hypothetical protein
MHSVHECSRMHSVQESLLRRRHSVGSETKKRGSGEYNRMHSVGAFSEAVIQSGKETDTGRERAREREREREGGRGRERQRDRASEQYIHSNAFSRRKPATKLSFSRKRNRKERVSDTEEEKEQAQEIEIERESDIKKRTGSCEAECIHSKDCSESAIQSVAKSLQSQEGNEKEEERDGRNKRIGAEKSKAFSRKHPRSRHSVGSAIDAERKGRNQPRLLLKKEEIKKKKESRKRKQRSPTILTEKALVTESYVLD